MSTYERKIGNNADAIKPTDRLIMLLRSDIGFQVSPISPGRTGQEDAYDEHQKDARSAMLEAEYKKVRPILAMQQHGIFS